MTMTTLQSLALRIARYLGVRVTDLGRNGFQATAGTSAMLTSPPWHPSMLGAHRLIRTGPACDGLHPMNTGESIAAMAALRAGRPDAFGDVFDSARLAFLASTPSDKRWTPSTGTVTCLPGKRVTRSRYPQPARSFGNSQRPRQPRINPPHDAGEAKAEQATNLARG